MPIASASHLKQYAELARLLFRYGSRDLVARAGLEEALEDDAPPPSPHSDDEERAKALAADLERLGPTYIKLGQLLSTRADLLPPAYLDALSRLQDRVEPFDFSEVERILQEELGFRLSKGFASFDPTPFAAASLGQVHRATLRNGAAVAVKVQRPDARERVTTDLAAFAELAAFLDRHVDTRVVSFAAIVDEFRKTLMEELDYHREAQNLVTLARNIAAFPRIIVPKPVDGYSTRRVLTMEFVAGTKVGALNPAALIDLPTHDIVEDLFRAYLRQVLIDGFFHADPHPGNVLITPEGRLALIDLGMVHRLSTSDQEHLLKLVLAVAEGRGDQAAQVAIAFGEKLADFDAAGVERDVVELVGKYENADAETLQAGSLLLHLARVSAMRGLRLPGQLTMLAKTLLNIDKVARTLAPGFDIHESIRRNASRLMQERMRQSLSWSGSFAALMEFRSFLEALPNRLNHLFDAVSSNEFKLKMEVIDEGALIEGFQKVANRIALGLVLAALIVGASMLMQVPTTFRLFGYPGFAMLLFIAAAAGGAWLAISIVAGDRRRTRGAASR
jgi:predicted unusual protein kinase regulating ubiquinone biosynthesis (AarF/ABC1/UbiB family)